LANVVAFDDATQAELLRFKAADAVSIQGAGKITLCSSSRPDGLGSARESFFGSRSLRSHGGFDWKNFGSGTALRGFRPVLPGLEIFKA
jgi:hypothetical protein